MRYIDHTNCKTAFEKGEDHEIQSLGKLTRTATKIAEANGLGVLKNRQGYYRIIKKSGLGAYGDVLWQDCGTQIRQRSYRESSGI